MNNEAILDAIESSIDVAEESFDLNDGSDSSEGQMYEFGYKAGLNMARTILNTFRKLIGCPEHPVAEEVESDD